jgi:hypothetical protein
VEAQPITNRVRIILHPQECNPNHFQIEAQWSANEADLTVILHPAKMVQLKITTTRNTRTVSTNFNIKSPNRPFNRPQIRGTKEETNSLQDPPPNIS